MNFADTNWLASVYIQPHAEDTESVKRRRIVERFMRQHGGQLAISHVVLLEARSVRSDEFRGHQLAGISLYPTARRGHRGSKAEAGGGALHAPARRAARHLARGSPGSAKCVQPDYRRGAATGMADAGSRLRRTALRGSDELGFIAPRMQCALPKVFL